MMANVSGHTTTCRSCGTAPAPGSPLGLCPACLTARMLDWGEDEPEVASVEADAEAAVFAKYDLTGEVARGGMGNILRVQDRKLGRTVAMKMMRLEASASEEARQRFIREGLILARLEHPNIVPLHELGKDEQGRLYYTMKLVEGETLQDILKRLARGEEATVRQHPLDQLLLIFRKVCDALAFAHDRGIIHRDLKPENIMVGQFGEVLVMDWGLAKFVEKGAPKVTEYRVTEDGTEVIGKKTPPRLKGWSDPEFRSVSADVTMDGSVVGTPRYMSPEQARGLVDQLDQRSDVFSLGAILYTILTLRPPVEGESVEEILKNIAKANITPPSSLNRVGTKGSGGKGATVPVSPSAAGRLAGLPHCPGGRVPAGLSAVTMRALARRPGERYQSVEALAKDVEAFQGGFETSVENLSLLGQLVLLVKRHHREFGIAFAAWFVITALAVWFVIRVKVSEREASQSAALATQHERHATREAERARQAEQAARQAEAHALQEQEETRRAWAKSQIALAEAAYLEGDVVLLNQRLTACPENQHDSTWHYLDAKRAASLANFTPRGELFFDVLYAPGKGASSAEFILGDNSGDLWFVGSRDGAVRKKIATGSSGPTYLSASRDGSLVCVSSASDATVRVFDVGSRNLRHQFRFDQPKLVRALLSPDALHLLVEHRAPYGFFLMDLQTGRHLWSQQLGGHVYFEPAGRFVVHHHMNAEQDLWLLDPRDGSRIRRMEPGHNFVWNIGFSPDGELMAAGDIFGYASVWELATGRLKQRVRAGNGDVTGVKFTRQNLLITLSSEAEEKGGQRRLRLWDLRDGQQLDFRLGLSPESSQFALDPETGHVLCGGAPASFWRFPVQRETWSLPATKGSQVAAFFGDDHLFAPADRSWYGLYHLSAHDPPAAVWTGPNTLAHSVAISADHRMACVDVSTAPPQSKLQFFTRTADGSIQKAKSVLSVTAIRSMALDTTGHRFVAARLNRTIQLIERGRKAPLLTIPLKGVKEIKAVRFADADRRIVAVASAPRGTGENEDWLLAWDAQSGTFAQGITNRHTLVALAATPDGSRVAVGGGNKEIAVYDGRDLALLRCFRAHDALITALAFHPTRPVIASCSEDFSVKVWNYETGQLLDTFLGPTRRPGALSFSASGRLLACNSADNTTRIWKLDPLLSLEKCAQDR